MGFEPQIRGIVDMLPGAAAQRQTLFFTATWPREVKNLAAEFLHDPVQLNIGSDTTLNANKAITQNVSVVQEFAKEEELLRLLAEINGGPDENPARIPKTIIFVQRKSTCDDLEYVLREAGYHAGALHGDKAQAKRDHVMDRFRSGRISILIATDIAARGLDVKVS
jgi:ATP-dependent RNA helicase DDX5/DBP2